MISTILLIYYGIKMYDKRQTIRVYYTRKFLPIINYVRLYNLYNFIKKGKFRRWAHHIISLSTDRHIFDIQNPPTLLYIYTIRRFSSFNEHSSPGRYCVRTDVTRS